MTDKEKIKHLDTLIEIRQKINGCFGTADGVFAGHPADEKRAQDLRKLAADNNIVLAEIQDIVLGKLFRKGYTAEHIKEQFKDVTDFFGKKLS